MTTSTRLHIAPFTADLARAVLGANVIPLAQNISYHTACTFPENNYGFVDLPSEDARALAKKLNGTILRGKRMRVEEARPRKRKHTEVEAGDGATDPKPETRSASSRKAKQEKDVLGGRELSPDRQVKRGWTESSKDKQRKKRSKDETSAKPQQKSKYSEDKELLFRTRVPANKSDLKATKEKKPKGGHSSNEVVHEFAKSTKQSTFLRSPNSKAQPTSEYVEGTGWVDQHGNFIEPGSSPQQLKRRVNKQLGIDVDKAQSRAPIARTKTTQTQTSAGDQKLTEQSEEDTSSSGSSSDEDHDTTSASSDSDAADVTTTPAKVHPLEALFKKPSLPSTEEIAKPSLEIETGFSFFGQASATEIDDTMEVPTTPFTANEMRNRGTRSAAPTPDTAHPSRFTSFESALNSTSASDRDSSAGLDRDVRATDSGSKPESQASDFEKRFWEMRGDNNRSWKARRRAALKEKRQKENKARRPKNW